MIHILNVYHMKRTLALMIHYHIHINTELIVNYRKSFLLSFFLRFSFLIVNDNWHDKIRNIIIIRLLYYSIFCLYIFMWWNASIYGMYLLQTSVMVFKSSLLDDESSSSWLLILCRLSIPLVTAPDFLENVRLLETTKMKSWMTIECPKRESSNNSTFYQQSFKKISRTS